MITKDRVVSDPRFKGVPHADTVGRSGLEFEYNQYLQGQDGYEKVTVNAQGQGSRAPQTARPRSQART